VILKDKAFLFINHIVNKERGEGMDHNAQNDDDNDDDDDDDVNRSIAETSVCIYI
jgi:hypothetical protein